MLKAILLIVSFVLVFVTGKFSGSQPGLDSG